MLHGVTLKLKGLLEGRLFWRKDKPGFDILKVFDVIKVFGCNLDFFVSFLFINKF